MTDSHSLTSLVPKLAQQRVLVLGDVILDEYLLGRATRMSREAPVPVLEFESRQLIPGGAANPAATIVALGSAAVQVGVIGADAEAALLTDVLLARGIDSSALIVDTSRPTTVKTRIMAHMGLRFPQQVARLDRISRAPLDASISEQLESRIHDHIASANAVLLSDYHIGMLTPPLVECVRRLAADAGVLLAADAQGSLDKYAGFGLVKCNADDAQTYLRRDMRGDAAFGLAARELCAALNVTHAMVITRGVEGATLALPDGTTRHCPAPAVTDVYDTVGAGDTAIAVLALAVLGGATVEEAVMLSNFAAGIVVRRVGNYAPTPAELVQAITHTP